MSHLSYCHNSDLHQNVDRWQAGAQKRAVVYTSAIQNIGKSQEYGARQFLCNVMFRSRQEGPYWVLHSPVYTVYVQYTARIAQKVNVRWLHSSISESVHTVRLLSKRTAAKILATPKLQSFLKFSRRNQLGGFKLLPSAKICPCSHSLALWPIAGRQLALLFKVPGVLRQLIF